MIANQPPSEPIRAPRGSALSCKGWHQEAAMRMLMNNLDPEVAERPQDLVVYGGSGKAARNWECYYRIVESLKALEKDHAFLLKGDVFSHDVISEWISYKMKNEVAAVRLRPHPYEFALYYDI